MSRTFSVIKEDLGQQFPNCQLGKMEGRALDLPHALYQPSTTATISEDCITLFQEFSKHQPRWSGHQLAHLKSWIASLKILEDGNASVNYGLHDNPDVCNLVTQQLDILKINLEKRKYHINGYGCS